MSSFHHAGKLTLINLIMDSLNPTKGFISRNGNLCTGHFMQHIADRFDLQLLAVENVLIPFTGSKYQLVCLFLGRFQIQGTDVPKPMMMLPGGHKSHMVFVSLAYQKPHFIISWTSCEFKNDVCLFAVLSLCITFSLIFLFSWPFFALLAAVMVLALISYIVSR